MMPANIQNIFAQRAMPMRPQFIARNPGQMQRPVVPGAGAPGTAPVSNPIARGPIVQPGGPYTMPGATMATPPAFNPNMQNIFARRMMGLGY